MLYRYTRHLDIDTCALTVGSCLVESEIEFKKLKWLEIGLYLRYNLSDEELVLGKDLLYCRPHL